MKVMFTTLGNFCYFRIFVLLLLYKILSSNLTFRIRQILRYFWKKFRTLWKIFLIFLLIIFKLFISNQREKLYKMATLTFRVGDHIFFIWSLKNHMTFVWDFLSKIFGNILKIFKLIFLESPAKIIENATFYFFKICPCFFSTLLFIL
jgi:hypothetical protein